MAWTKATWLAGSFVLGSMMALGFGVEGTARAQGCPHATGVEDFGNLNQGPRDVAIVGSLAYTADLSGLTIYGLGDPEHPVKKGELLLPHGGEGLTVLGNRAYVVGGWDLHVVDVSDPAGPVVLGSLQVSGAHGIAVDGEIAYVGARSSGLQIVDVSDPSKPVVLDSYTTPGSAMAVVASGGLAYVADGEAGLVIVDVSNPAEPKKLGAVDTPGSAWDVAVAGGMAYVADDREGLQVVDVSDPAHPVVIAGYDPGGFAYGVEVAGELAYLANWNWGLQILDVSDPAHPHLVGAWDQVVSLNAVAVSGDQACLADVQTGLHVLDVGDATNPEELGSIKAGGFAYDVAVSGSVAHIADGHAGLQLVDVSNPGRPEHLGGLETGGRTVGVAVSGKLAAVAAGNAGAQLFDVSDPAAPVRLGSFVMAESFIDVALSGDRLFAMGVNRLQILDISDPASPVPLGSFETSGYGQGVAVSGDRAFLAENRAGLEMIDISDPFRPRLLGSYDTKGMARDVAVSGNIVFVADGNAGVAVIDVSDPSAAELIASLDPGGFASRLVLSGDVLYVAAGWAGLQAIDVSDPRDPVLLFEHASIRDVSGVAIDRATGVAWLAGEAIAEGVDVICGACPSFDVTVAPASVRSGGATATVTVSLADTGGDPLPGRRLEGSASSGSLSVFSDAGNGRYTATYTSGSTVEWAVIDVWEAGSPCSASGTVHVTFSPDPSLAGPLPPQQSVIPGSAHVAGAQGTAWRTDAVLHNPGKREASAALFFLESDKDGSGATGKVFSVPPGRSLAFEDLVLGLFGRSASGAILVASDEHLLVTSRTYNDAATGTYGQFVPGLPLGKAVRSGEAVRLIQLRADDHFRTNIGFANLSAASLHVGVELFRWDGGSLGTSRYTVPPWSFYQKTRAIPTDRACTYAVVSSEDPEARYFTYASVVDNGSGDPTFILPVPGEEGVIFIPAAAHVRGSAGTNWKTDLELHNPGAHAVHLTVEALVRDQANPSPPAETFSLTGTYSMPLEDVLDSVFGVTGAAALRITPSLGPLMVTSRTYNDVAGGTYGQFIPGVAATQGAGVARGARLLQLSQSADDASGFRTNIGLTNVTGTTTDVEVVLHDGEGGLLGTVRQTLEPWEFVQIDRIFRRVTTAELHNGFAVVSSATEGAAFFAYASVVDNRSGDPVNMPAMR